MLPGLENPPSTSLETKKLVAAYLRGVNLNQVSVNRRVQLSGGAPMGGGGAMGVRPPAMPRSGAMRAAARADQRQAMTNPYQTSPHKHPPGR